MSTQRNNQLIKLQVLNNPPMLCQFGTIAKSKKKCCKKFKKGKRCGKCPGQKT